MPNVVNNGKPKNGHSIPTTIASVAEAASQDTTLFSTLAGCRTCRSAPLTEGSERQPSTTTFHQPGLHDTTPSHGKGMMDALTGVDKNYIRN